MSYKYPPHPPCSMWLQLLLFCLFRAWGASVVTHLRCRQPPSFKEACKGKEVQLTKGDLWGGSVGIQDEQTEVVLRSRRKKIKKFTLKPLWMYLQTTSEGLEQEELNKNVDGKNWRLGTGVSLREKGGKGKTLQFTEDTIRRKRN